MNPDAPTLVFYILAAVEVIAWLFALQFMLSTTRRQKSAAEQEQELQQLGAARPESLIAGTAEVAGSPAELAAKVAAFLAKQGPTTLGAVKIMEHTQDRVAFEGAGSPQPGGGRLFSRGEFRFTSIAQNRTPVDYAVEVPPRSWLLTLGWVFIGLGLLAIVVTFVLIQTYVVGHPNPDLRWQGVQMLQASHFIWPPFLFGGIYRRLRTHVRTTFETLVHNLPYHEG